VDIGQRLAGQAVEAMRAGMRTRVLDIGFDGRLTGPT
jgi:hypothetical protein